MPNEHTDLLKKKIECVSFDISIYPRLDDLLSVLGKLCVEAISRQTQATATLKGTNANMRTDDNVLDDVSETSAFYWMADQDGDDALLVILSPAFVGALSECLLGGEFALPDESPELTTLDLELTQSLIEELRCVLNIHIGSDGDGPASDFFTSLRSISNCKDVFRGKETTAQFIVSINFNINGYEAPDFVTFVFPVEVLECAGFLESKRNQSGASVENTQWFNNMRGNILNSSVDLTVIFERFTTTIGELSRLKVDQVIPVSQDAYQKLSIELPLQDEILQLGSGRLGTVKDLKAAKVTEILI